MHKIFSQVISFVYLQYINNCLIGKSRKYFTTSCDTVRAEFRIDSECTSSAAQRQKDKSSTRLLQVFQMENIVLYYILLKHLNSGILRQLIKCFWHIETWRICHWSGPYWNKCPSSVTRNRKPKATAASEWLEPLFSLFYLSAFMVDQRRLLRCWWERSRSALQSAFWGRFIFCYRNILMHLIHFV